MPARRLFAPLALAAVGLAGCAEAQAPSQALPGFHTDTSRRTIELDELRSGGPPKDGIPALDLPGSDAAPAFVSADEAAAWLAPREPVVLLRAGGEARIYPLQILTWHEIANDELGGVPVAVTFCPLCYAAVVFDRRLALGDGDTTVVSLGVSGLLRRSDMVMFDRATETLWQQLTGEALVGAHVGRRLRTLPAQLVSFERARAAAAAARVLSRRTGHARDYGRNPYVGYDDVGARPFLFTAPVDGRLPPLERLVAVERGGESLAVAFRHLRDARVHADTLGGAPLVVFWEAGTATALGDAQIARGRDVGAVGVFAPEAGGRALRFRREGDRIVDEQTGSTWRVTGEAEAGPLAGQRLAPTAHHDTYAFAWLAFRPGTRLVLGE